MRYVYSVFLIVLACTLAACTGSREATQPAHPASGAWDFTIDSPDGVFQGQMIIAEEDGVLGGVFTDGSGEELMLENVAYEDPTLTFDFTNPQYGKMSVSMDMAEEDAMKGTIYVHNFGANVPIEATRAEMQP